MAGEVEIMAFTQDDKQKISSLLQLASLGITANSGVKVQANNCPCGGTCSSMCGGNCGADCCCQGGCSNAGPTLG